MAYDKKIAEQIREVLPPTTHIEERKMFGGIAFLLDGKMSVGVLNDVLVARVAPEDAEKLLSTKGVRPMDFTGRPMKGFLYVEQEAISTKAALKKWVDRSLSYTKSLPQKKKKR
ncbi:RNA methyltransferase [Candidatus Peregrinibacteria bacterium CG11_big_fil_rev_8_21_14_0_20_46_8]|nr:MAG: RNA methyltransferase [Candidatus Peregrinibacteria bacterium CG11_big_fil_rev_8_21_14_0_20_46_8]